MDFVEKGFEEFDNENYEEALSHFEKAMEDDSFVADDRFNLAIAKCYFHEEDYVLAFIHYEEALNSKLFDSQNMYDYIYSLYSSEKYDQALKLLDEQEAENSEDGYHNYFRGYVYFGMGDKENALTYFSKAAQLGFEEAKAALQMMVEQVNQQGSEKLSGEEESQIDPYYEENSQYPYFGFPENESDKSIHKDLQKTYKTINYTFKTHLKKIVAGIVLLTVLSLIYITFLEKRADGNLSVISLDSYPKTIYDTELISFSRLDQADTKTVPGGTVLRPVAWYRNKLLVQLPDGDRGLLEPYTIDQYYRVSIGAGTPYFRNPNGSMTKGFVPQNEEFFGRITETLRPEDATHFRRLVRFENGIEAYIDGYSLRNDLHRLELPVLAWRSKRVFHANSLAKKLMGKDENTVIQNVSIPVGIQNVRESNRRYLIMAPIDLVQDGKRYRRLAVEIENDRVVGLISQGESRIVMADTQPLADFFHSLGITNVFYRVNLWEMIRGGNIYERLNEKSLFLGIAYYILMIIVALILIYLLILGFFGIPILTAAIVSHLLAVYTPLPNGFIKLVDFLIIAIVAYLFYSFSLIAFNIEWGTFMLTLYAIILIIFYLIKIGVLFQYLDSTRCASCKNKGLVRSLGSYFLGRKTHTTWNKVFTRTEETATKIIRYYQWKPTTTHSYNYQDLFGCRRCGRWWSWQEATRRPRRDMEHNL